MLLWEFGSHRLKVRRGRNDIRGENLLTRIAALGTYAPYLGRRVPVYDWSRQDGYRHLGDWVEAAVRERTWW